MEVKKWNIILKFLKNSILHEYESEYWNRSATPLLPILSEWAMLPFFFVLLKSRVLTAMEGSGLGWVVMGTCWAPPATSLDERDFRLSLKGQFYMQL